MLRKTMKRTRTALTLFGLGLALTATATAQQRGRLSVDPLADAVLGMANDMVEVGALADAPVQGEGSAAPQDEEGAAPASEVQDNGTNPASMGFKFMPYTRHTELENGVSSSDVLTLFAMIPLPATPYTAITLEWPVQKSFDASSVFLDFLEDNLDPELGIPCAPPVCGSDRPLSDVPLEAIANGFDQNGYGDFSLRLLQGLKLFGKPGEGMTTALMAGFQLITPTASHPILGEERWEFAPLFAHIHNFSPRSFLALMHLYFFDFADKSGISELHKDSDVGYYLGRYFYQYAWPKSGYYLLPELQITYDNEGANGWSAFLMPEMGKSFQAGSMGMTAYIKPGWAVLSPDPSERRFSVEMGMRLIP